MKGQLQNNVNYEFTAISQILFQSNDRLSFLKHIFANLNIIHICNHQSLTQFQNVSENIILSTSWEMFSCILIIATNLLEYTSLKGP